MNSLTRLVVASGGALALALTASPALAAPPTLSGNSNGALVERRDLGTHEYTTVTRQDGGYYTTNSRDQDSYQDENVQWTFDWKAHYTELENVTRLSSQTTFTQDGVTCRTNSLYLIANGETRQVKEPVC